MITYSPELHNKNQMVFRKYNFSLSQPARVRLNFKSNIDNKVSIKLIETETEKLLQYIFDVTTKYYLPPENAEDKKNLQDAVAKLENEYKKALCGDTTKDCRKGCNGCFGENYANNCKI